MKLKDIVPYCLDYDKKPRNGIYESKYYWVIDGLTYTIDSLETKESDFKSYIHLSRYNFVNPNETQRKYDPKDNYLVLNLDNDITIHNKFIMVHKTLPETTEDEANLFFKTHYFISNSHYVSAQMYNIGLFHTDPLGGMIHATNLRSLFKDLVDPPVQSKPSQLTLDEKVDNLIDEIEQDARTMAIKKLKRMLNDRL